MPDGNCLTASPRRTPWSKGKLIGAKPPLRPSQVWSIRTRLLIESRARDLALFNLAIDSKLRGCDVVALKVEDIAPNGYAVLEEPAKLAEGAIAPPDRPGLGLAWSEEKIGRLETL
jgi:hypothetical protein